MGGTWVTSTSLGIILTCPISSVVTHERVSPGDILCWICNSRGVAQRTRAEMLLQWWMTGQTFGMCSIRAQFLTAFLWKISLISLSARRLE